MYIYIGIYIYIYMYIYNRSKMSIILIYIYIYAIMKTMCSPGYHHNGFVATHAFGHMMYIIYSILYIYWQKYKLVHYI